MKILFVTGYDAWTQISRGIKPSHHLFGIHQLIDHYEKREDGSIQGVLKKDAIKGADGGTVDFYIWESVRKGVTKHLSYMLKEGNKYDLIYDCLNRCSVWLGIYKMLGIFKPKVITIMHHPSYKIGLNFSHSDAYIFFNEEYKKIGIKDCRRKQNIYYVNEWYPDTVWYDGIDGISNDVDAYFLDNGKTERDRELMISSANKAKVRIDYPGNENESTGYARRYKVDLSDYTEMTRRMRAYKCLVVPVKKFKKPKIGPLGITSFLDCIALKIPVITSDNTCFADDIEKYGLGIAYKTGNEQELSDALIRMKCDKEFYSQCCKNIEVYSRNKTIFEYGENVKRIINATIQNV